MTDATPGIVMQCNFVTAVAVLLSHTHSRPPSFYNAKLADKFVEEKVIRWFDTQVDILSKDMDQDAKSDFMKGAVNLRCLLNTVCELALTDLHAHLDNLHYAKYRRLKKEQSV